jgi:hypothetical protein
VAALLLVVSTVVFASVVIDVAANQIISASNPVDLKNWTSSLEQNMTQAITQSQMDGLFNQTAATPQPTSSPAS